MLLITYMHMYIRLYKFTILPCCSFLSSSVVPFQPSSLCGAPGEEQDPFLHVALLTAGKGEDRDRHGHHERLPVACGDPTCEDPTAQQVCVYVCI